jgi:hypothetical protein
VVVLDWAQDETNVAEAKLSFGEVLQQIGRSVSVHLGSKHCQRGRLLNAGA